MRRSDRRPARRPPLRPELVVEGALDEHGRALAVALLEAFPPTIAWQWACTIRATPAGGSHFSLRFERHHAIADGHINRFAFEWREPMSELAPALTAPERSSYAGLIFRIADDALRVANRAAYAASLRG